MPIYQYQCQSCDFTDDLIESFSAPRTKKCPQCGIKKFIRIISAPSFQLSGTGWYVTDFRDQQKQNKQSSESKDTPKNNEQADTDSKNTNADKADKKSTTQDKQNNTSVSTKNSDATKTASASTTKKDRPKT